MDWATAQIAIVLLLTAVVFFGFIRERIPPDIVALSAVGVLLGCGILESAEVLSVFSNSAPITIGAMFVLSAALERTGVIDAAGRLVERAAGRSPSLALGALMLAVMAMSAFINNTPVVVVLTPVAISLARALQQPATKLLIPLSFASIFGGTTTLIGTSTNILVDGVARQQGQAPFGMFEITGAGLIMGVAGVLYMVLTARWLLPARQSLASLLPSAGDRHFLAEAVIPADSPLAGKTVAAAGLTEARGVRVIDVVRRRRSRRWELGSLALEAGDRLVLESRMGDVLGLREAGGIALGGTDEAAIELRNARETAVLEGVVGPVSRMIGRRVAELDLGWRHGIYVLAVHRRGESLESGFGQVRLRMGDTLLLEGPAESLRRLFDEQELISLAQPADKPLRRGKAPIAIVAVLAVMLLAALDVLPIAALAIMAATAVVALRCLDAEDAYAAVRWNILMLIFGMLALGLAMEKTGAARLIVESLAVLVGGFGPLAVLSGVYAITSLLTEFMSNNAAAILLTPIAIGLAQQLGVDPRPFVVAVMFGASASFATPIGYQTNTFVYNAGGYRFVDFVKVGVPLNLLFWALATLVIPLFWPLD
jgi:di/tricarboxylate transporter